MGTVVTWFMKRTHLKTTPDIQFTYNTSILKTQNWQIQIVYLQDAEAWNFPEA